MTQRQSPGGDFEERLLAQLKATVAERGAEAERLEAERGPGSPPVWRRRGPRLALGGGIAVAALVAAALIFSAGGGETPKAFAVEPQPGGGETIQVYGLQEASDLEEALEEAGIQAQVTWLPSGMVCREPHFTPSIVHLPGGGAFSGWRTEGPTDDGFTFEIGSTRLWRKRISNRHWRQRHENVPVGNVNLDPRAFRPDQTVILSGAPLPYLGDPEGALEANFGVAEGPVEPCEPVPGPKDHQGLRADEEQARHDPRFREATTSGDR